MGNEKHLVKNTTISFTKSNTVQAFWVGLGMLSMIFISILSASILSRYLDKSTYGSYRQILYVYTTLVVVFNAGLPKVFAFYLPKVNQHEAKAVVNQLTKLLFVLGFLFSLSLFAFSNLIAGVLKNDSLGEYLRLFAVVPFFLFPTIGIEGIYTSLKRSKDLALYNFLTKAILFLCIISPIFFDAIDLKNILYGWIVGSFLTLLIALYYKKIPFKEIKAKTQSPFKIKEILSYSLPLVMASLSGIALVSCDQFFISRYFGQTVFAEYANGFTQLPFISLVSAAAAATLMPVFSKLGEDISGLKTISNLFKSTLYKSALIIYPILLFFLFNAEEAMTLLYSNKYKESTIYFQLYLTISFVKIIVFAPILMALGETRFYAKLHFYFALIKWGVAFLVVLYIPDPLHIAILSVIITILLVAMAMIKTVALLKVTFVSLVPVAKLATIILHSFVGILGSYSIAKVFSDDILLKFAICFILFTSFILSTGKLIKLDYLLAVRPFINRQSSKKAK